MNSAGRARSCAGLRLWLGVAGLAGGCVTGLKMAVPTDLAAQAPPMPVEETFAGPGDESFSFGPYGFSEVARTWKGSGELVKVHLPFVKSKDTTEAGYSFGFRAPDGEARAVCATRVGRESRPVVVGEISSRIEEVKCRCEGGGLAAESHLKFDGSVGLSGTIDAHGQVFSVRPVSRYENGKRALDPKGYAVHGRDMTVGALETVRPGRAWVLPSLDQRTRAELACALGALWLYQPEEEAI